MVVSSAAVEREAGSSPAPSATVVCVRPWASSQAAAACRYSSGPPKTVSISSSAMLLPEPSSVAAMRSRRVQV